MVYESVAKHSRESEVVIPPQKGAAVHLGRPRTFLRRDEYVWGIREVGRRQWYIESGMTKRSTVENVIYRYKAIIGREMRARTLAGQRLEARLGCHILNRMAVLGMRETERAARIASHHGGDDACHGEPCKALGRGGDTIVVIATR